MKESLVFFGSGGVAAEALELLAKDFVIEAVITKPQPQHHKAVFPVLETASRLKLKTHTPANKHELSNLFIKRPLKSRLGIVIDYGIIFSQDVIDYFPLGIVNSHFSLLPRWRGADPISFAILEGDRETGVSLMLVVEKLDEGPLLAQESLKITSDTTTPSLTEELIGLSHQMLTNNLPPYVSGQLEPYPQPVDQTPTYSRKLTKRDGEIDWQKSADRIEREIRAFAEWPKSRATLGTTEVIVTRAHAVPSNDPALKAGAVTTLKEGVIMVECGQGYLCIDKLKPIGKPEMTAQAFLAGYKI